MHVCVNNRLFSNAFRAALELEVRKSSSIGVNCSPNFLRAANKIISNVNSTNSQNVTDQKFDIYSLAKLLCTQYVSINSLIYKYSEQVFLIIILLAIDMFSKSISGTFTYIFVGIYMPSFVNIFLSESLIWLGRREISPIHPPPSSTS